MENNKLGIENTGRVNIIYIFTKNNNETECKIGKTSIDFVGKNPSEKEIEDAAIKRGKGIFGTAGDEQKLHYACLAIRGGKSFSDNDFHEFLEYKAIIRLKKNDSSREWFKITPENAKILLKDYINGSMEYENKRGRRIKFRDEQIEGIKKTFNYYKELKEYKSQSEMLWDCVMRFGKTLTSYGFVNECIENNVKCEKVLILSHRTDVNSNWHNDFASYRDGDVLKNYEYGSNRENIGKRFSELKEKYFYFCSIQKLRRTELSDDSETDEVVFDKNNDMIFSVDWDLIIIDEGHEGIVTNLAGEMFKKLKTKMFLFLSGTPFKLLSFESRFTEKNYYSFTYIDEIGKKEEYRKKVEMGVESYNPYENLPEVQIFCQNIKKDLIDSAKHSLDLFESGFDINEFFSTNEYGKFKNERDVVDFLNNLTNEYEEEKFKYMPYSPTNWFNNKHALWWINNVKTAKALEELLKTHKKFKFYRIINAAGGSDDGESKLKELKLNIDRIKSKETEYIGTITLTLRRLTTGVTVPEWTCVMMLNECTSAQSYFQTAFRCKTMYEENGIIKKKGNIYDFNPDRVLQVIPKILGNNLKKADTEVTKRKLGEFLNAMPIIAYHGNELVELNVEEIMKEVKTIYARKIVDNGFECEEVIDRSKLFELSNDVGVNVEYFEKLFSGESGKKMTKTNVSISVSDIPKPTRSVEGESKSMKVMDFKIKWDGKTQDVKKYFTSEGQLENFLQEKGIDLNEVNYGFVPGTNNKKFKITARPNSSKYKGEATVVFLDESIKNMKQYITAITARMPLLILALPMEDISNFSLSTFPEKFDDYSWQEFICLGKNADESKKAFKKIIRYLDETSIGKAVQIWNNDINIAFNESQTFDDIYTSIIILLRKVKNPDKETVLTPENVVNIHYEKSDLKWEECEKNEFSIFDINSKSGIYPLYAMHKIYLMLKEKNKDEVGKFMPNNIIKKNIFVLCKTNAAVMINKKILGVSKLKESWVDKHIIQYDIYEEYEKLSILK